MSCLFLSISDREPLWSLTFPKIEEYCKTHGFEFHKLYSSLDSSRHISWSKIIFLIQQMKEHPEYKFYIWLDDDIYITNVSINIQNVINNYNFNNILISEDVYDIYTSDEYPFNCGVLVCKNKPSTMTLLEQIYRMGEECGTISKPYWEQDAFIKYYKYYMNDPQQIVTATYRSLQSFYRNVALSADNLWKPNDFIAHFTGMTLENRIKYLRSLINNSQVV